MKEELKKIEKFQENATHLASYNRGIKDERERILEKMEDMIAEPTEIRDVIIYNQAIKDALKWVVNLHHE